MQPSTTCAPASEGADLADGRARCLRAALALAASLLLGACGVISRAAPNRPSDPMRLTSPWPNAAEYATITAAVRVRDQALRLTAWNQKAYAAQLGLSTLVTLEGSSLSGKCAAFVAHIYDELMDLNQAQAGENWRPLVSIVAHDPSVASQCRAPDSLGA